MPHTSLSESRIRAHQNMVRCLTQFRQHKLMINNLIKEKKIIIAQSNNSRCASPVNRISDKSKIYETKVN